MEVLEVFLGAVANHGGVAAGDHLRVILPKEIEAAQLLHQLQQAGFAEARMEAVEASLEDVFLALAAK